MPVQPTYPGVYIEEVPSGVRAIVGVATSTGAFIGNFQKGLWNEAVHVFNFGDFEREFGGLHRDSETSYAVQQFFQNGGTEAWIVRVASDDAVASSAVLYDQPVGGNEVIEVTAGQQIRGEAALNPGDWGDNIRVEVDYDTTDPTSLFNLTVSEIRIEGVRTTVLQTETFRNLTMVENTARNAIELVNQGSRLVQLSRDTVWPLNRPAATGTLGNPLPSSIPDLDGADITVDVGSGPHTHTLAYDSSSVTSYAQLRPILQAAIRALAAGLGDAEKPLLSGATVQLIGTGTNARFLVLTGRGARPFDPATTLALSGSAASDLNLNVTANVQQHSLTGGNNGTLPIPASVIQGSQAAKTGIYALEDADIFNILCMPEAARMSEAEMRTVYAQTEAYCEERRAMLIVDIAEGVRTLDQMTTWLSDNESLRHRNAAVYFPRTMVSDPLNDNRPRSIGASGTVAGLYARTDTQRGVWKAPAGTDARLRNVQSLPYVLTDQENGVLNPLGVNCLRTFPVYSNICWGARTLEGADVLASDWKYIPVRRLTLFIEESLYRGTKWAVFEPNDEPLWSQIRLNLGAFMHDLFRKGAFQGASPNEAYFVKCDHETTTQTDINNGIVNIEVGFAPLKPAEFVIIKIQQMAGRTET